MSERPLEVSIGDPHTQELLLRARDIDPEAWASPLRKCLAKRRGAATKKAYAELLQGKTEIAYAQTPVDEIEVTLTMIEAGQAIFAPHIMTIAPVFVAEIYRAMERVRRESSGNE